MKPYPDHQFLQMGSSSLWVAKDLDGDPKVELLANPDVLFSRPECEIIKDQRKIKVGRLPLKIGGRVKRIYLKRYNVFSWRYRLGSLFMPSGALHSWVGAGILMRAGFRTGQPLAAIECRTWGMLQKSFYVSGEISGGLTLGAFWDTKVSELDPKQVWRFKNSVINEVAQLFRSLHQKNIYHNDLKEANIIVREQEGMRRYYFTDLERVSLRRRLSRRRRVKNLVQIDRTLGRTFSRGRRLCFLREYLQDCFGDKVERRRWILRIIRESRRADLRSQAKLQAGGLS